MQKRVNVLFRCGAVALSATVCTVLLPAASTADATQEGEDLWVPSLSITSGITVQKQEGTLDSFFEGDNPMPVRDPIDGDDLAVSAFVGGNLELMSPALPVPLRPRLFVSGEIIPTFGADRDLAKEGQPSDCIRGPGLTDPCTRDQTEPRDFPFDQDSAVGQGQRTTATFGTLTFGAALGVALPFHLGERQLRVKPSFTWINYEIEADGYLIDPTCQPSSSCEPNDPFDIGFPAPGFMRETILRGSESKRFNGIGPGIDVEMDTGRFGPLGTSIYLGARFYHILGDRSIRFETSEEFDDLVGMDTATARWEVEIDPWMYRAHLGFRLHWLGFD